VPGVALAPTFRQPAQVLDLEVGCVDLGRGVLAFGELVGDGGQEIGALGQAAVGEVRPQPGAGDRPEVGGHSRRDRLGVEGQQGR
jgi:hypothetical protein